MKKWKIFTLISWIFFITFPLILGQLNSDSEYLFGGLFFNPIDGYSYFAKMQQGYAGELAFQLPYASQANNEILIFTFYILIGHLSRILGLSIPIVYHIFRVAIAVSFFFSLGPLLDKYFPKDNAFYKGAFLSILFGGGLGWLYFLSGDLPVDFWVSEAFVFLSAFSNPHFMLTFLCLSLLLNLLLTDNYGFKHLFGYFSLGLILVNISPFAAIIFGFVMIIDFFINNKEKLSNKVRSNLSFGLPVVSIGMYQYFTIKSDPILSIWNLQNVTTTPTITNLIFGLSPLLIGSVILFLLIYSKKIVIPKPVILLICWIIFSIAMGYFPFNLQRRFLVGIYLPLSVVFWYLLSTYTSNKGKPINKLLPISILVISVISNLIVFAGSSNALINQDPLFFIKSEVNQAVDWMDTNIDQKSVILANEKIGLEIPALGNYRVVYGHPFESLNAEKTQQMIEKFWENQLSNDSAINFLKENNVDYIFCELAESGHECPEVTKTYETVYKRGNIVIFQVQN